MNGERFILAFNGDILEDFDTIEEAKEYARQAAAWDLLDPENTFEPLRFSQVYDDLWEAYTEEDSVWSILIR